MYIYGIQWYIVYSVYGIHVVYTYIYGIQCIWYTRGIDVYIWYTVYMVYTWYIVYICQCYCLGSALRDDLGVEWGGGRQAQEGEDICTHLADSPCWTAETNTAL